MKRRQRHLLLAFLFIFFFGIFNFYFMKTEVKEMGRKYVLELHEVVVLPSASTNKKSKIRRLRKNRKKSRKSFRSQQTEDGTLSTFDISTTTEVLTTTEPLDRRFTIVLIGYNNTNERKTVKKEKRKTKKKTKTVDVNSLFLARDAQ